MLLMKTCCIFCVVIKEYFAKWRPRLIHEPLFTEWNIVVVVFWDAASVGNTGRRVKNIQKLNSIKDTWFGDGSAKQKER